MTIDGITGVTVNLFLGPSNSDSTSGYVSLFSTIMPFAVIMAAGVILLTLDVIGVKSGKSLGKKLIFSMISTLLPVILIIVLVSALSALVPFAAGLFPGQAIPSQVENMIIDISSNPLGGATASQFPIIGSTDVYWGLGIGSYLFIVAAAMKVIGGFIVYSVPNLKNEATIPQSIPPPMPPPMPPPPPTQ